MLARARWQNLSSFLGAPVATLASANFDAFIDVIAAWQPESIGASKFSLVTANNSYYFIVTRTRDRPEIRHGHVAAQHQLTLGGAP
jgi:hypothetical protein